MAELRRHETVLLWLIRCGVVAVLLAPLVVTPSTIYPFVVGKALFSRAIIEIVVGLWMLLALANPHFRPPRSWLLILLALGLAWSFVAACFGVSFQRSMWSDYQRMTGWIDAAHWFAFVVVVVSVFRSTEGVRSLLNLHLGVGLLVAGSAVLLAVARTLELPLPLPEREVRRIGGLLGNSNFLGAYCMSNALLALGFLACSVANWHANGNWRSNGNWRTKMKALPADQQRNRAVDAQPPLTRTVSRWIFWALVALLSLVALVSSGSFGSFAALGVGLLVLSVAGVWLAKTTAARCAAIVALGTVLAACLIGTAVSVYFIVTLPTDEASMESYRAYREDTPVGSYVSNAQRLSAVQRLEAVEAGLEGIQARPWLGWGAENFLVVWGRAVDRRAADLEIHDSVHNKIVEEGVGKGLLGVVLYLAPWVFAGIVVVRKIRRERAEASLGLARGEVLFLVFVGATMAAFFVQSQLLFDTTVLTLQFSILFALIVHLEPTPLSNRKQRPEQSRWQPPLWLRLPTALGCLTLAAVGVATNLTIYDAAAKTLEVGEPGRPAASLERAISLFEPLASEPRLLLIRNLANKWQPLRLSDSTEAKRLLRVAQREGERALAAEPENWLLHHVLANLYETVARSEPEYAELATYHRQRGTAMAPLVSHRS